MTKSKSLNRRSRYSTPERRFELMMALVVRRYLSKIARDAFIGVGAVNRDKEGIERPSERDIRDYDDTVDSQLIDRYTGRRDSPSIDSHPNTKKSDGSYKYAQFIDPNITMDNINAVRKLNGSMDVKKARKAFGGSPTTIGSREEKRRQTDTFADKEEVNKALIYRKPRKNPGFGVGRCSPLIRAWLKENQNVDAEYYNDDDKFNNAVLAFRENPKHAHYYKVMYDKDFMIDLKKRMGLDSNHNAEIVKCPELIYTCGTEHELYEKELLSRPKK